MKYPDYETYRILYARYFKEDRLKKLLARLPFRGGITVDLCCGEGRVALEAKRRGATTVIAIDECKEMIAPAVFDNHPNIIVGITSIAAALKTWMFKKARLAICQQAVNYWLTRELAEQLHGILEPNGVFAFNTFNTCPSSIPSTESYVFEDRQYWECRYTICNMVHHVQACEGIEPHDVKFNRWDVREFTQWSDYQIRCHINFCHLYFSSVL